MDSSGIVPSNTNSVLLEIKCVSVFTSISNPTIKQAEEII